MSSINSFPRGSEWRKWDLHVHTPASFHWNGGKRFCSMTADEMEQSVQELITALETADAAAFGVMDYWTFDGYLALRRAISEEAVAWTKTLFPGMELRVEAPVDFRLNVHVVFPESIPEQDLLDFKSTLVIGGPSERPLSDEGLRALAENLDESKARVHGFTEGYRDDPEELLRLGSMVAEVTRESFRRAVDALGKEKCLVILPYDCSDGIEKLDWKRHSGADAFFLQAADIFESRSEKNIGKTSMI